MPIGITLTTKDSKGATSSTTIYVPSVTAFDDVMEFAETLAQLWANMSDGEVIKVGVTFAVDISGLASNTPLAASDVEEGGKFVWQVLGGYTASNRIPTFSEDQIVAASKQIDLTDPNVSQFVDMMTNGFTAMSTNVVSPVDYRGADIVGVGSALESFQTSRKLRQ